MANISGDDGELMNQGAGSDEEIWDISSGKAG